MKQAAKEAGLPIYQPEKLSGSPEMEAIMNLGADGIVTAAFGQFLPSKLLDSMDFAVNVHASLLPKHRGGAPIHYALIQGDEEAGVNHYGNGQGNGCRRYDFSSQYSDHR